MTLKRIIIGTLIAVALLVIAGPYLVYKRLDKPLPSGVAGSEADALAHAIQEAVHANAWNHVGAIRWTFMNQHHHLWDRQRQFHKMEWDHDNKKYMALLDLRGENQHTNDATVTPHNITGRVYVDTVELLGDQAHHVLTEAIAMWRADAYWINPFEHFFDADTQRRIVTFAADDKDVDAETLPQGLLITHAHGGLLNGGSYLWFVDRTTKIPYGWKMWVPSLSPIGGLWATWEDWINGDKADQPMVAMLHRNFLYDLLIKDIKIGATIADVVNVNAAQKATDPFEALLQR